MVILGLDRVLVPGVYWLNINDRDLPFLALVEHTNFLPSSDSGCLHLNAHVVGAQGRLGEVSLTQLIRVAEPLDDHRAHRHTPLRD